MTSNRLCEMVYTLLSTREAALYIISVVSVCLYVCICRPIYVCQTITFESLSQYLHGIQAKFVYEGHRVKGKVSGAKKFQNL